MIPLPVLAAMIAAALALGLLLAEALRPDRPPPPTPWADLTVKRVVLPEPVTPPPYDQDDDPDLRNG